MGMSICFLEIFIIFINNWLYSLYHQNMMSHLLYAPYFPVRRGTLMSISTFAAIDVSSAEVSMNIYEVSKKNGIREIDSVKKSLELGVHAITYRKINYSFLCQMCDVFYGLTKKMKEYQVSDYSACITSGMKEAENYLLILDQIKLKTGLKLKIMNSSEQRYLCYKAIALKETNFNILIQKGTVIVNVNADSTHISIYNKGTLIITQSIKLSPLRIRELLSSMKNQTTDYYKLIEEYMDKDLYTFCDLYLKNIKIKHLIAIGEHLHEFFLYVKNIETTPFFCAHESASDQVVDRHTFEELYQIMYGASVDQISIILGLSKEQSSLILPTAMMFYKIFQLTKAESMWLPGITLCDGLVTEYAEKKEKIIPTHSFTNDIISCARNTASRYLCDYNQTSQMEELTLYIYDHIRKLHGLGVRDRLLIQIAAILYNCGEFINMNAIAENSYHIIMSTEMIGLSPKEREMVATLVLHGNNRYEESLRYYEKYDKDMCIKLSKLAAILQLAHSLDFTHKNKIKEISLTIKSNDLIITAHTLDDITLEKGILANQREFFEAAYGISPILIQKIIK